jgi:hypothetical protein
MASNKSTLPIRCGHCDNLAPMTITASYSDTVAEGGDGYNAPPYHEFGTVYELFQCLACKNIHLRSYYWDSDMEPEDVSFKQIFPVDARVPLGLTESIERAYRAALKVKMIDANAFGVLLGRVIELVCHERGANGNTLSKQLQDLATRGELPLKLVGVADKLRALRNVGAHPRLGELTSEEIPIVEDLCRAILEYVFTAPYLVQRAAQALSRLDKHQ